MPHGISTVSTPSHPATALLMTSPSFVCPAMTVDASFERVEFSYAALAAHADHLIAAIQRVLDHVLPELPRRPDDADFHLAHLASRLGDRTAGSIVRR